MITWLILFFCRPLWFHAWCAETPTPCVESAVDSFDQIVFKHHSVLADFASNILQNSSGAAALLAVWFILKNRTQFTQVALFLVRTTLWNGALLEATRALVQRPRPLVFQNPLGDGANINQYTSFYSGHTSFVAMATLASFLWIYRFSPESKKPAFAFALFLLLTTLTGMLRILGGRHFPTDVIAAIAAGSLVALANFAFSRNSLPQLEETPHPATP